MEQTGSGLPGARNYAVRRRDSVRALIPAQVRSSSAFIIGPPASRK